MRAQLTQNDRTAELGDEFDDLADSQSALGWNDMGEDEQTCLRPVANDANVTPIPVRPRNRAKDSGRRAAFTLRLDAERHLKLRLAATIRDCSAQTLVTEALDKLLGDIPELDSIAAHVAGKSNKS
ncbi:hypothetical protein [Aurantiacibacter spongiae]|nr:hypothetical protein [Aurantiacibacter spongiae]